ncbi:MAG: T9SS type A sorting domain-containing protein [Cryomorphaceae bacterium]|nr:T9SS type A sorting domain-containing protein [Cryomorphaceae bacterium]
MKTFIRFCVVYLFALSGLIQASHVTGGEMTYRYIGDSTNVAHQYEITLVLYATTRFSPTILPNTAPLCIMSSCFPNSTTTMPAVQGFSPPGELLEDNGCISQSSPNNTPTRKMVYQTVVTLPGTCSNFRFQSITQCCRLGANNLANINTWGSNGSLFILAFLNNTIGENNSPVFTSDPQINYCVNRPVNMVQNVVETDGDSLYFNFTDSRTASGWNSCVEPSDISISTFAPGFSFEKPFDTQNNVVITIDPHSGNASFQSGSMSGIFLLTISAYELRLDTSDNMLKVVGEVTREIMVVFDNCLNNAPNTRFLDAGPSPSPGMPGGLYANKDISTNHQVFFLGYTPDDSVANSQSPTGYDYYMPDVPFDCSDTLIELQLSRAILNSSVDPTKIFVVGPDTQVVTTQQVHFNQPSFSDVISLELNQPLHLNGQHFVIIAGDTLNPMISICSYEFTDTILFSLTATNCPDFVSTDEHQLQDFDIKLSPNPANAFVNIHNPSSSIVHFTLYDLRGVAHHSGAVGSGLTLKMDISELPSGMYIMSFVDVNGRLKKEKIIKR